MDIEPLRQISIGEVALDGKPFRHFTARVIEENAHVVQVVFPKERKPRFFSPVTGRELQERLRYVIDDGSLRTLAKRRLHRKQLPMPFEKYQLPPEYTRENPRHGVRRTFHEIVPPREDVVEVVEADDPSRGEG